MEDFRKYISINPNIRFGKPCIVGTRISVDDILKWLASGTSSKRILKDFPQLKREHIRAAQAFAAEQKNSEQKPSNQSLLDDAEQIPIAAYFIANHTALYE